MNKFNPGDVVTLPNFNVLFIVLYESSFNNYVLKLVTAISQYTTSRHINDITLYTPSMCDEI